MNDNMAPHTKKVVSVYVVAGFGHLKPALALMGQIQHHKYPVETEAWDLFADASGESMLDKNSLYNRISVHPLYLEIWNRLSSSSSASRHLAQPAQWLDYMSKRDLKKRFKACVAETPDTIFFTTHFTPAHIASRALPKHKVFLYVTDIHPHPIWAINRRNIIYLVPLEYTRKLMMTYGIAKENIHVASFPINPVLLAGVEARHEKRLRNIQKEKTTDILIISGGAGTGLLQMQNLLHTFAAPAHAHQVSVTFLASTIKLRDALKETRVQAGLSKDSVTIDTYKPDTLYEAMKSAEVLITKAGGDITFEALAEGLPVYTLKDVGDHERINRGYMEQMGASRPLESDVYPWELIHHDLLTGKLKDMTMASYKAGTFHRSATVPKILFSEMDWKL